MTSRQQKQIRYVKCPKCARILPEPEQIPLYTCGGCGTILQAKYYKKQKEALVSTLPTVDAIRSNDNGHAREDEKSSDSCLRSPDDQSLMQSGNINEKTVDDYNSDQAGDNISASHTPSSEKSNVLNVEGDRQVILPQEESGESLEKKASQIDSAEHEGSTNSLDEFSSGKDSSIVQDKEAEQLPTANGTTREDGSDQDQYNGTAVQKQDDEPIVNAGDTCETSVVNIEKQVENDKQEQCDDIAIEMPEEFKLGDSKSHACTMIQSQVIEKPMQSEPVNSAEGSKVSVNETNSLAEEDKVVAVTKLRKEDTVVGKEQKSFIERIREKLASVTISNDSPKSAEVEDGDENPLPVEIDSPASEVVRHHTADCEFSLDDVKETSVENIENLNDSASNECGQSRPTNNVENPDPLDMHEKGSNVVKETSRSAIKEPPLAYDGSVSSCDGNDDRVPGQPEHRNGGTFTGDDRISGYIDAEENSRSERRGKTSAPQLSDEREKRRMLEGRKSARENERRGCNMTTHHRDGIFPPRVPFHRNSCEIAFETGSSSSYINDEPPSNWTRSHLYKNEERRGILEGRRVPDVLPVYHNDEIYPRDFYQKERYHGYSDTDVRRRPGNRFLSCNLPRRDYSGEVYGRGYQIHSGEVYNERYTDHHPDARQMSAQLPQGPPRYPRYDPYGYDPYPTNPRRLLDFELYGLAYDRAYLSGDQRHEDWIRRRPYMKEKRQVARRHFRPIVGGAPFITCHFCFNVLHLPEEFLVFKQRKMYRLKCGACSNILKYSLENDSTLTPQLLYTDVAAKINLESSDSRTEQKVDESSDGGNNAASSSVESRQGKVTWHLPARRKSPLHQLLGYSSPQDLLAAHTVDYEE